MMKPYDALTNWNMNVRGCGPSVNFKFSKDILFHRLSHIKVPEAPSNLSRMSHTISISLEEEGMLDGLIFKTAFNAVSCKGSPEV